MRDAVERITNKGNSSLLLHLADQVGNSMANETATQSINLMNVSVLNESTALQLERKRRGIVMNSLEFMDLPAEARTITVSACEDYTSEVLDFSRFSELEELKIGARCFNYVSKVSVAGLKKLRSIEVGEYSFQNESNDSELVLRDCPELTSLNIGNGSFKGFKEMKLSEVKALKTITIGDECLKDCDLVLKDLKSVESVMIGVNSFEKSRHNVVESASDSQRSEE